MDHYYLSHSEENDRLKAVTQLTTIWTRFKELPDVEEIGFPLSDLSKTQMGSCVASLKYQRAKIRE
jgi:hypothetical protein